jgi:chromosome partitioning protein
VADLFLLPVQPRSFDIWALDSVSALVREAREINALNVLAFLNAADSQGHDNEDAAAQIREFPEFEYFDQPLARRKAFPNAAARGLSVLEYTPRDLKAIEEFTFLAERVFRYHSDTVEIPYGNCKEPQTTHKHS